MNSTPIPEPLEESVTPGPGPDGCLTEGQRCIYDKVTGFRIIAPPPGHPHYAEFEKFLEDLRRERGDLSSLS
jgi:hypothetical protein